MNLECVRCHKPIGECESPDLDSILEKLRAEGLLVYPMCSKCFKHIDRCKCIPKGRMIMSFDN